MGSGPTLADERLAELLSERLSETVRPGYVKWLRECGLVSLRRPGRHAGKGGRMPGTYPRRMVKQGAEAIGCVRTLWNHDVAAAVMHLRGFDIAPSALRRLWLGTEKRPGPLIRLTESDPDPVAARAENSTSAPIRQMARILGSRRRAQTFAAYAAFLLSEVKAVEENPPAVTAPLLGVEPWEPLDVNDSHLESVPESVVRHVSAARSALRSLPGIVRGAGKAEWDNARDLARKRLELATVAGELRHLFPRHSAGLPLDPREFPLSVFPDERMAIVLVPLELVVNMRKGSKTLDGELIEARAVLTLAKAIPARIRPGFDDGLAAARRSGSWELDAAQTRWLGQFAERRPEVVAALPNGI